jgi:molybdopterin-containing oxidoreductase family iron-sulfur binding subunit
MEIGGIAQGLLVTSIDGRPIKIEGNPNHPLNRGAADAIAQASILELYDPDRSRGVIRRNEKGEATQSSWEEFAKWAKRHFTEGDGRVGVLSEATYSPSFLDMWVRLHRVVPDSRWFVYEPLRETIVPWERYSLPARIDERIIPAFDLSHAKVIVSLDADLFGGGEPLGIKHARDFGAGRRLNGGPGASMNRLYVIESRYTVTGAAADHRRAVRPSELSVVVRQLAHALGVAYPVQTDTAEPKRVLAPAVASGVVNAAFIDKLAADLKANVEHSLVVAGPHFCRQDNEIVAAINEALGNVDKTISYYSVVSDKYEGSENVNAYIGSLAGNIKSGEIGTLLIVGGNPAYTAPADLKFAETLKKIENTVYLGLHENETSRLCRWHLSQAHYLEAWGDARTYDGTVSIVQPLIEPLFDGRSATEVLAMILGDKEGTDGGGYAIVRRTLRALLGDSFDEWKWKKSLADGVVDGTAWKPTQRRSTPCDYEPKFTHAQEEYEVVFFSDSKVYDGRFANNGWLQEMPDPMTRLTWDNAAVMSPKTAEKIGAKRDELVALQAEGTPEVLLPAFFLPGMPEDVIALALGYGRTAAGNVGTGVGQNVYVLRDSANPGFRTGVKARATGQFAKLATVQDHHIVDAVGKRAVEERVPELVREVSLAKAGEGARGGGEPKATQTALTPSPSPASGRGEPRQPSPLTPLPQAGEGNRNSPHPLPAEEGTRGALSIFDEHKFDGRSETGQDQSSVPAHDFHRWGMVVDLTACTGCGACVVACQAENNIPIVGKEQVLHGREMHWIRVDRYFRGEDDRAEAVHQPVLCMHCENAPCESVCPVAATTHSQEGINMMTYNRCVGTRYCSNNCPYKVRRFNFFDYNRGTPKDAYTPNLAREAISELQRMQKNPEVTVRMRGVMEKCTYCVQRIEQARIAAKRDGDRPIRDGEIQTACQQTCPTQAIVFGDLNDPNSRVSKLRKLPRAYGLLDDELNTKPRTVYLAKVKNTVEGLEG